MLKQTAEKRMDAPKPEQYASGYSLHLYCDQTKQKHMHDGSYMDFPHQFTGETFAECARDARVSGWNIHRATRTATCPRCTGKA